MGDKEERHPTAFHRMLSQWFLQSEHPRMSMATLGWPFAYTLVTAVLVYGVGLVIVATHPTSKVALALATVVFGVVALVSLYVAMAYTLKLLFMPLNVDRDPLTYLLDYLDTWIMVLHGLTCGAIIIYVWDELQFTFAVADPPTYRIWLRLLFMVVHDFHSAGFGTLQVNGDWSRAYFIIVSFAGRLFLVMGIAALARLMSRNLKRFAKRYRIAGIVPPGGQSQPSGRRAEREKRLNQVGMDQQGKRTVAKRGTIRTPSTVSVMKTPSGGMAVFSSRSGRTSHG